MLIKVCGLTDPGDASLCLDLGADLLGFVFHPASPRCVTPEAVAAMPRGRALRVGVFTQADPANVSRVMGAAGLDLAQLHGGQSPEACARIGPHRVIKVLWPETFPDAAAFEEILRRFAPVCRMFLFDAGTGGGGHGRSLGSPVLSGLAPPRPWLLAGGLGPGNVLEMAGRYKPWGVDLNSEVETRPGRKSASLLLRTGLFPRKIASGNHATGGTYA
jgi:phosphoribosylanthranilate isomerase